MILRDQELWGKLPDDLFALSFENEQAEVILNALESDDPLVRNLLDVLRLAVSHIDALQDRIDQLPHEEECPTCGAICCACAYDSPTAICGLHYKKLPDRQGPGNDEKDVAQMGGPVHDADPATATATADAESGTATATVTTTDSTGSTEETASDSSDDSTE